MTAKAFSPREKIKIDVSVAASMEHAEAAPEPGTPFRILLLGDFSGRSSRGIFEPAAIGAGREPLRVDRDNLEEKPGRPGAELDLEGMGDESFRETLRFDTLDAFHPDKIFERAEVFRALREARERLKDPKTYEAAAALVRAWTEREAPARTPEPEGPAPARGEGVPDSVDLVKELIAAGQRRARDAGHLPGGDDWNLFLQRIVQPHLVPREDPAQPALIAGVDRAAGALMRAILHHPEFQALEAAWRALDFLVRRLETDGDLQLFVFDVSKAEVAADLSSATELSATGTYKLLVERTLGTPGGSPWAVVAGNYTFDQTPEDVAMLSRMAKLARAAGAPFLAAASPQIVGCRSLAETPDPSEWRSGGVGGATLWEALRELPEASYLGLALPRFLLRLPYGKGTDPLEAFDFDEVPQGAGHEDYLWGNPGIACLCLLGQAFGEYGWGLRPGVFQEIDGLPLHVYKEDGESRAKPCAETLLTFRAAEIILEKGLMPLLSIQGRDSVRLGRFQSIRNPLTPLAGRWGS
jgi:type VI secretion system protein ImpC